MHSQPPSDSAVRQATRLQPALALRSSRPTHVPAGIPLRPDGRRVYDRHSQRAEVLPDSIRYKPVHFLSIPQELRLIIYEMIVQDTGSADERPWHRNPGDQLAALAATCRQAYHETNRIRFHHAVPWNRLQSLLMLRVNITTIARFQRLSLEISLDAHPGYFTGLDTFLHRASPHLKELRLYFAGSDIQGRQVYTHGCGSLAWKAVEHKLPIAGQRDRDMLPLWKRIAQLSQLRVLVISNANLQIFESMLLIRKPNLERLCISTDPRSTLHRGFDVNALGFLLTARAVKDEYPPIKVLQIPANAALASVAIATKVAPTLEHLTWIVPDESWNSNHIPPSWDNHTAELLGALALRGRNLHTLRICLQGRGFYEQDIDHSVVMGAFKLHLPRLQALRRLEIHGKSRSWWFGKELVARLPNGLEHLYVTDRLIHPLDLMHQIRNRYLVTATILSERQAPASYDVSFFDSYPDDDDLSDSGDESDSFMDFMRQDQGPWLIDPITFAHHGPDVPNAPLAIRRYRSESDDNLLHPRTLGSNRYIDAYRAGQTAFPRIGEERLRYDYIPYDTGKLKYVHYEYDDTDFDVARFEFTVKAMLFLVNGRLIDKLRNEHLADTQGPLRSPHFLARRRFTEVEPPAMRTHASKEHGPTEYGSESATQSAHPDYSMMLARLYETEHDLEERTEERLIELGDSIPLSYWEWYFGNEDEATEVFEQEMVAKAEHLPTEKRVMDVEAVVDGKCHWMCPEARSE